MKDRAANLAHGLSGRRPPVHLFIWRPFRPSPILQ